MIPNLAIELAKRYPDQFTLQYPPAREYFRENFPGEMLQVDLSRIRQILVYLHIPFCEQKCAYCNFAVLPGQPSEVRTGYVDALIEQLTAVDQVLGAETRIPGIDLGGGTPTALEARDLERLLTALIPLRRRLEHPWPISVETTPEAAANQPDRLRTLVDGGVGRISLGLQTTNTTLLSGLGRGRNRGLEQCAAERIHEVGFQRFNVDLIFGLPGQELVDWTRDLTKVIGMGPDSVTTYDCLYRGAHRLLPRRGNAPPTPEHYGRLYDEAYERLITAGFHAPYGSVNFSRRKDETGTSAYFEGRLLDGFPYLGLGNEASSLVGHQWWFGPAGIEAWKNAIRRGEALPYGDLYHLPAEERMAKYILLSLSFGRIDPGRFQRIFSAPIETWFGQALEVAQAEQWLVLSHGNYLMPPGSFRHLPALRSLFYSERALRWLASSKGMPPRRRSLGMAPSNSDSAPPGA